ncbi:MAG: PrsW family glutamic-type intramembrane protease [Patescibacteria group bacterium]
MPDIVAFSNAFLIGFVPILLWLIFWLLEDIKHPEPRKLIARAFFAGMVCVLFVIPLQKISLSIIPINLAVPSEVQTLLGFLLIFSWAGIEEALKLFVAWLVVLRHTAVDEPIDVVIYLITVSLGFAALENTLFLITPLANGQLEHGLITGNLRFIGATLIHVLSSATIGMMLATVFFKNAPQKIAYGFIGVILASVLHAFFNFSIIVTSADWLLTIFAGVWVGITFLLLMLEKIKLLKRPAWWEKMFVKK